MITRIDFNWFFSQQENSEGYERYVVGINCTKIEEHLPFAEGDRVFYDIYLEDGTILRTFNPNLVEITKEN